MRTLLAVVISLISTSVEGFSQHIEFEAASVKPVPPNSAGLFKCNGGPATPNPIRFNCSKATLNMLASVAYNTLFTQVVGPRWTTEDAFEVVATMPPDITKDEFRLMMQNLLRERFHITVHKESRETRMYALRVAAGGPKLTRAVITSDADKLNDPVDMKVNGGRRGWHLEAKRQSMKYFARYLTIPTRTKVLDETGLSGEFDFSLDFDPKPDLSADPAATSERSREMAPNIFMAIKSLGLKLEPTKGPLEFLVIDTADRTPTDN